MTVSINLRSTPNATRHVCAGSAVEGGGFKWVHAVVQGFLPCASYSDVIVSGHT